MEYYSAIETNETESFAVTWMDLESVIHSEASLKELWSHLRGPAGLKKKKTVNMSYVRRCKLSKIVS